MTKKDKILLAKIGSNLPIIAFVFILIYVCFPVFINWIFLFGLFVIFKKICVFFLGVILAFLIVFLFTIAIEPTFKRCVRYPALIISLILLYAVWFATFGIHILANNNNTWIYSHVLLVLACWLVPIQAFSKSYLRGKRCIKN